MLDVQQKLLKDGYYLVVLSQKKKTSQISIKTILLEPGYKIIRNQVIADAVRSI